MLCSLGLAPSEIEDIDISTDIYFQGFNWLHYELDIEAIGNDYRLKEDYVKKCFPIC